MSKPVSGSPLYELPEEMQAAISQFLPSEDLAKIKGISKLAESLLAGDAVWGQIAENLKLPQEEGKSAKERVTKYYKDANQQVFNWFTLVNQQRQENGLPPYELPPVVDNPYQQQSILRKHLIKNSFLLKSFADEYQTKKTLFLRLLFQEWARSDSRALFTAIIKEYPMDVVKLIYENLPKNAAIDKYLLAACYKYAEAAHFLLSQNIDFDLDYALFHAVKKGTKEVVQLLLQKGAIVHKELIKAATQRGANDIVELLEVARRNGQ